MAMGRDIAQTGSFQVILDNSTAKLFEFILKRNQVRAVELGLPPHVPANGYEALVSRLCSVVFVPRHLGIWKNYRKLPEVNDVFRTFGYLDFVANENGTETLFTVKKVSRGIT
jgi:hypothetical protein